jgi:CubicO group peptidase (beta-lactamase class C family)
MEDDTMGELRTDRRGALKALGVGAFLQGRKALGASSRRGVAAALTRYTASGEVPGLVAGVARGGRVQVDVLGVKTLGGRERVRRDSLFRVASMTKPVTAAATMILVDEGKLKLDEPVDRLLPELSNRKVLRRLEGPLDDTVPATRAITVRDLLTFRLGFGIIFAPGAASYPIQQAMDQLKLGQGMPDPLVPPAPDEWIRRLGTLPLMHQPGERWMYNTGTDVLGVLIARASGQSFDAFLHQRIFEPLGMRDTGFFVPPSKIDRLLTSYDHNHETGKVEIYDRARGGRWSRPPAFPSGSAGLVSTVDDFLTFGQLMLSKGQHRGKQLLSRASVEEMTKDQLTAAQKATVAFVPGYFERLGWGLGMAVVTKADDVGRSPGAFGWDGGLGTSWFTDPGQGVVGVLLTQQAFTSPYPPNVVQDFWRAIYGKHAS